MGPLCVLFHFTFVSNSVQQGLLSLFVDKLSTDDFTDKGRD